MEEEASKWVQRFAKIKKFIPYFILCFREKNMKDVVHEGIDLQNDYIIHLAKKVKSKYDYDVAKYFHDWEHHKTEDIATYRFVYYVHSLVSVWTY